MPFLAPALPFIAAGAGAAGSAAGIVSQIKRDKLGRQIATQQQQTEAEQQRLMEEAFGIAKQRAAALEPLIQLLSPGSQLFRGREAQMFGDISRDFSNRLGQVQQLLQARGYGYGPSGVGAALWGEQGRATADELAQQRLANLFGSTQLAGQLRGEQAKMTGTGGEFALRRFMGGQVPEPGLPGAIGEFGKSLGGLTKPPPIKSPFPSIDPRTGLPGGVSPLPPQLPLPTFPGQGGPGTTPWMSNPFGTWGG